MSTYMYLYLFLAISSIPVFVCIVDGVDTSCDQLNDLLCSTSPCICSELENCASCSDGNSIPCTQCANGYFRPYGDYKCANCKDFFGESCDFCTNNRGCQQCATGSGKVPKQNECGLYTCDDSTYSPSEKPSIMPTNLPTQSLKDVWEAFITNFLTCGVTIEELGQYVTNDFEICLADIGCGGLELDEKLLCICDVNAIVAVRDIEVDEQGRFIFSIHFEACENSINGLFWTSGPRSVEIDVESGLIKRQIFGWHEEADVDFIRQYIESNGTLRV